MNLNKRNQRVLGRFYQKMRIKLYSYLNTFSGKVTGIPISMQPLQLLGKGKIEFGSNVLFGYFPAPHYYKGLS
jgi:hypothetical protein